MVPALTCRLAATGQEEMLDGQEIEVPPPYAAVMSFLQRLCTSGDVYRRIVCAAVLEDPSLIHPPATAAAGAAAGAPGSVQSDRWEARPTVEWLVPPLRGLSDRCEARPTGAPPACLVRRCRQQWGAVGLRT